MHNINIDIKKNRLYFTLGNIEDEQEMKDIISKTSKAVKSLKPGFTCLSDLREYVSKTDQDEQFIRECQFILWDAGISKVVRVTGNHNLDKHLPFENKSLVWPGYLVEIADSAENAESLLD